ncbi:hypothetical protein [Flavobacterium sp.]|uniref:hypothetical protein n=1 Tax=Flavobacterium sp. TaxID=239 RepID=UPI003D0E00EC
MKRFQDENKFLGSYDYEILVKCPKCESKSSVKRQFDKDCKCGKCTIQVFECKKCFHKLEELVSQYVAYGKPYCNKCFKKFEFESQVLKEIPEKYKTKCPHCNFQEEWKPKIREILQKPKDDGLKKDRWFNLTLWFQKEVSGNIFWAYNVDHIQYLERYIEAGLRERNSKINFSASLVARLPKFVKAAKNREKLLKIVEKWKE